MITYALMMAIQEKTRPYTERVLGDDFNPFAIETYGCVFIFVLIHFLLLVHRPLSCIKQWFSLIPLMFFFTINNVCP